jgi:hypothetical protein
VSGRLKWPEAENLADEEAVPTSRVPWATLCPLSLGQAGGKAEPSTQCCSELSACCTVMVLRMLFSHWYTSPTPSVDGAGNVSKSAATATTFWLALAKVGSCRSACSIEAVQPTLNTNSCWCRSISLASTIARSSVSLPHCHAASCLMSSCGMRRHSSW